MQIRFSFLNALIFDVVSPRLSFHFIEKIQVPLGKKMYLYMLKASLKKEVLAWRLHYFFEL